MNGQPLLPVVEQCAVPGFGQHHVQYSQAALFAIKPASKSFFIEGNERFRLPVHLEGLFDERPLCLPEKAGKVHAFRLNDQYNMLNSSPFWL
jgi:hypothetical protein